MNKKMTSTIRKDIFTFLEDTDNFENNKIANKSFLDILRSVLKFIQIYYGIKNKMKFPLDIIIKDIEEDICVDNGLKLIDKKLILSNWVLQESLKSKKFLLYFFLIKSCFLIIFNRDFTEFDHAILNFLSILFIKEIEKISSINNVVITYINPKIFPEEIANTSWSIWHSLLNLLFISDVPSQILFDYYCNIDDISLDSRVNSFSNWVTELTVKTEDVIAPIYMNWKLMNVLDLLAKYGYDSGTTKQISKTLNVNQTTVRSYFDGLTSSFNTYWRAVVNFQKLNLHNYYIRILFNESKNINNVSKKLFENPYLKALFLGENEETKILYSPTFICPHTSSDNLSSLLSRYKDKNIIDDYSIQLVRRKIHYSTVTSYPYKATLKNFKSFIYDENENLKRHMFADEKRDFSTEFELYTETLDYNLLYFLSLLRGRFLIRGNYGVWVKELAKLYEKNDLSNASIISQNHFMNQIEIRSRRRDLLSFSLWIRNFNRKGADILIIEIPMPEYSQEKIVDEIIEKLRVFSMLAQMNVYDSIILTIPGANHQHPIRKVIEKLFNDSNIFPTFYTLNLIKSLFIPYHKLYDFEKGSWKIY